MRHPHAVGRVARVPPPSVTASDGRPTGSHRPWPLSIRVPYPPLFPRSFWCTPVLGLSRYGAYGPALRSRRVEPPSKSPGRLGRPPARRRAGRRQVALAGQAVPLELSCTDSELPPQAPAGARAAADDTAGPSRRLAAGELRHTHRRFRHTRAAPQVNPPAR